jgi:hypothetical protein
MPITLPPEAAKQLVASIKRFMPCDSESASAAEASMTRFTIVAAFLVGMVASADAQRAPRREFSRVTQRGEALADYHDGVTQVVAAYYHSQRNHDTPWLLIEVGMSSAQPFVLRRDRVRLVSPSGRAVLLAEQIRWGADSARARGLLQQAQVTRHQVRTYFLGTRDAARLRFFGRPEKGQTVVDLAQSLPEEVLLGDLLFESPTGAWERGTYALEIEHDGGTAALPIHLR